LYEECKSNCKEDIVVRLWKVSLYQNNIIYISGQLITNRFVLTVARETLDVESIHTHPHFTNSSLDNNVAFLKLVHNVPNSGLLSILLVYANIPNYSD
ncbi:uncharacterized protein Dere_GG27008, partial [Drosophila erecta]